MGTKTFVVGGLLVGGILIFVVARQATSKVAEYYQYYETYPYVESAQAAVEGALPYIESAKAWYDWLAWVYTPVPDDPGFRGAGGIGIFPHK